MLLPCRLSLAAQSNNEFYPFFHLKIDLTKVPGTTIAVGREGQISNEEGAGRQGGRQGGGGRGGGGDGGREGAGRGGREEGRERGSEERTERSGKEAGAEDSLCYCRAAYRLQHRPKMIFTLLFTRK